MSLAIFSRMLNQQPFADKALQNSFHLIDSGFNFLLQ